ncbi:hypothetical protein Poly51_44460 [Rubripirellula tenax]|uniref:PEP-CTERM protein-sorting domain-containing protein n=1 Tax=Rubripirellula tenax TaxID=2528015 RepID=A0A5C6ELQ3_9BACT|nr:hypothetical protein [Rubripirellula tenax]TWU48546.1 hypothetical protein Poly51_44460 [Rubripirellula tenax]
MRSDFRYIGAMACTLLMACSHANGGTLMSTWTEVGDAGDTLATANITFGSSLTSIVGTLPDNDPSGVDIFALSITNPSMFSASTDNFPATDLLDSWLYLFDENGLGVAASATTIGGSPNATISQGSVTAPAGLFFLAVTRFESVPQSLLGSIFTDLFSASTNGEVIGPLGPGGNSPLTSWTNPQPLLDNANYRIDLTGAGPAVPEPTTAIIWIVFAASLIGYERRMRVRSQAGRVDLHQPVG